MDQDDTQIPAPRAASGKPAAFITGASVGAAGEYTVLSLYGFGADGSPDCPVAAVVLNLDMLRQVTGLLAGRFNEIRQAQDPPRIVVPS